MSQHVLRRPVVMHFVAPLVESRYRTLLWFDAFGLALVTVTGTVTALDVGAPALVAIAMGAVTGSVGGIIRDTLGHVPSVLLRHEIYITASVRGACTYVGLNGLGLAHLAGMTAGFLVTFSVQSFRDSLHRPPSRDRKGAGPVQPLDGSTEAPGSDFPRGSLDVVIDASSIDTGVADRDAHLRCADFFDVEVLGQANDPWGSERAAFSATTSIDRREFGLTWNQVLKAGGVMVGDRIDIAIDIEAVRQVATQAA